MAAPKKATHIVAHSKQYLAVEGKLQLVPQGTGVVLTKEQAEVDAARARPLFVPVPKGSALTVGEVGEGTAIEEGNDGGGE